MERLQAECLFFAAMEQVGSGALRWALGRPFAGSALHVDRGLDGSLLAVRWTRLDKLELSDAVLPQGATVEGFSREAGVHLFQAVRQMALVSAVFDDGPGDLQAVEAVVAADATMVGPPCGNWRVRSGGLIGACLVVDAPLVAATVAAAAAAAAVAAAVAVYKRTPCLRHRLRYLRSCSINLGGG